MCDYCEESPKLLIKDIRENLNGVGAKIEKGHLVVQAVFDACGIYAYEKVNFCPMCGRSLRESE